MARPLRIEYPSALYHVTVRGNNRQAIFLNNKDRKLFLTLLADVIDTHNIICYAYCLMDNHYHLLLETPDANLAIAMRDLNGMATQFHNKRYCGTGHLFQGRYKAFLIEKELYLLAVARYIVLNPVRAEIVKHPRQWAWSSYNATVGDIASPAWLSANAILKLFSKRRTEAQKAYRDFVMDGINTTSPFNEISEGIILGSPQFISAIWHQADDQEMIKEIPRSERIIGRPTLADLFAEVTTKEERNKNIQIARQRCGYLVSEIARFLKLDRSTVGKITRQH